MERFKAVRGKDAINLLAKIEANKEKSISKESFTSIMEGYHKIKMLVSCRGIDRRRNRSSFIGCPR